jgi:hypothetical protein
MRTDPDDKLPFFLSKNNGFGQIRPEDDLLHPDSFKEVRDDSATETQYFGFSIPEESIHAATYLWWHPNLRVCTGGIIAWQGVKTQPTQAELCDWRTFMSDAAIRKNDLNDYRLASGFGVRILEPLKRFHMTYADPASKNSVDLIFEGVLPCVMFADGNHFEQTMHVTGELVLRGKKYQVDCFNIRDRSWGKTRPELPMRIPPMSWMCGTFSRQFSFNCTMFDHVSGQPERNGEFVLPDDQALNAGWVYRDGTLGRVVKAFKRAIRGAGSTICDAIELRFTDDHGREFDMRATLNAYCTISLWNNAVFGPNLMRWECDGLVGYGDNQEGFWGDFLNSQAFRRLR